MHHTRLYLCVHMQQTPRIHTLSLSRTHICITHGISICAYVTKATNTSARAHTITHTHLTATCQKSESEKHTQTPRGGSHSGTHLPPSGRKMNLKSQCPRTMHPIKSLILTFENYCPYRVDTFAKDTVCGEHILWRTHSTEKTLYGEHIL
jgi:hypothetical protein